LSAVGLPQLLIATSNAGKLAEFQRALAASFACLSTKESRFAAIACPEVTEDGETYFENALKKAAAYYRSYRVPVLADDSGLEVVGWDGGPGIHSARFGGEGISWPRRWELLIERLEPLPPAAWSAQFRCVLCYYDGQTVPRFYQATVAGRIVRQPAGGRGFGYDPIFFCTALGKTFGEATDAEKEKVSHRGLAIRAFREGERAPA
jgi:XTP/dITP diphosphohydrolase